jgi:hypothetical protein
MSTIEQKVLENQEKIKQFILPVREKVFKQNDKNSNDSKKMSNYSKFDQWDQGFNQHGK